MLIVFSKDKGVGISKKGWLSHLETTCIYVCCVYLINDLCECQCGMLCVELLYGEEGGGRAWEGAVNGNHW